MDFIKIRFGNDFGDIGASFDKTIKEMFQLMSPGFTLSESSWKPHMDIYETPDEIFVVSEIAGVERENLELEINSKAVKVSGHRINVPNAENARYRIAEIQYGKFKRVIFLPSAIDTKKVSATYTNGLLEIRMAKTPLTRVKKTIIKNG